MEKYVNNVDVSRRSELDAALALLHFGFRAVVHEPDRLLAERGFGRAHHRLLFFLARAKATPLTALVAMLGVTRQALHRPLAELIRDGYAESKMLESNRRVSMLSLTAKGRRFEERLSGLQREAFAAVFAKLGPAAEKHWRAVMAALAAPVAGDYFTTGTTDHFDA